MQAQVKTNKAASSKTPVVAVDKNTAGRLAVLTRRVEQLRKHEARLHEIKTPVAFQKAMGVVVRDVEEVATLVDQLADHALDKVAPAAERPAGPSTVAHPVDFVKTFLDKHPNLPRKDAILRLSLKGVNFSTARTQYQKWFKARQH